MRLLRGIGWDHVRGHAPLIEAARLFENEHPDVQVVWDKRSLEDFESYPVEELAEMYDLILIDHPFVGTGVKKSVLEPIDKWVPADFLEEQFKNSVGRSFESYTWEGHQWALAIDAASQVAAYRKDLLENAGERVPETWSEVDRLIVNLPTRQWVAIPLSPTHAYSSFLTLCAQLSDGNFWDGVGIRSDIGEKALQCLKHFASRIHPESLTLNPIQMSELMVRTNEVAYVPLMFGYCNYAQAAFAPNVIHYTNIPKTGLKPAGALLGGVGLAISALSSEKDLASKFAMFVASRDFQCDGYFEAGGQPGHRGAWLNEEINMKSNNFFKATLETLDCAYIRPRKPGYNQFQDQAGSVIHDFLQHNGTALDVIQTLNKLFIRLVDTEGSHFNL